MSGPTGRVLALLSLLQVRRDWPGAVLAERLEVTERTVRRDVDRLRELGYVVEALRGPAGGYRLEAGEDLPPLLFDDDQAVALAVALRLAAATGADVDEGAVRALTTLRQVMPSRLRHRVDAVEVSVVAPARSVVDTDVLVAVGAAVRAREVLRVDLAPPDGSDAAPARRRVEPHHVVARGGRWYLVAWDLDRDDWRTFRVDRLTPRVPTGPRFAPREVPGGDVGAFVEARFKGSSTVDAWPCTGSAVVALPAREVAPYVGDGTVETLDDARCRVTAGSWSWTGLAASFARFDADLTGVEPTALREAFGTLAGRARGAAVEA